LIDQIDFNVSSAEQHTEKAVEQLTQAATFQRSARRKKIFIIVLIVTILAIIGAAVGISIGTRSDD